MSIIESVKKKVEEYKTQKSLNEICHLAAVEIHAGGSFVVDNREEGGQRIILTMNLDNFEDTFPKFKEVLKKDMGTTNKIRFTILNKNREETASFEGTFRH